jgi:hypothetical protein
MAGWRQSDRSKKSVGSAPRKHRDDTAPADAGREDRPARRKARLRRGESRADFSGNVVWFNRMIWPSLAVVLIGATIIAIFWWPPPLPMLACVVDYRQEDSFIPPNAFAGRDAERMLDLSKNGRSFRANKPVFSSIKTLIEYLEHPDVKPGSPYSRGFGGGPSRENLVIYLSAHGVVNGNGEACLLDDSYNPLDDAEWTTVSSVLTDLEEHVPKDVKRVLLLLDSGRAEVDWNLGWLDPDFPKALQATWEGLDPEPQRIWLVHSRNAAAQRNWTSPRLRASAFGMHVVDAFTRAADTNVDGEISFDEFREHLEGQLSTWVKTYRDADQKIQVLTPAASTKAKRFRLAWAAPQNAQGTLDKTESALADVRDIADLWNRLSEEKLSQPWRTHPLTWARLQHKMLEIEQLWVAGAAYGNQFADARALLSRLPSASDGQIQAPEGCPLLSSPVWFRPIEPPAPPAGEAPAQSAPAITWGQVFDASIDNFRDRLRQASQLRPTGVEASEAAYARLMEQYFEWNSENPQLALDLFLLRRSAEIAAALPAVQAWQAVHQDVLKLDERRRKLEDSAWIGGPAEWDAAKSKLSLVRDDYQAVESTAAAWVKQLEQRDQIFAELPWLLRWAEASQDQGLVSGLLDVRKRLWLFRDDFQNANTSHSVSETWKTLWSDFEQVRKKYNDRCKDLGDNGEGATSIREALQLLQAPLMSGSRSKLLAKLNGWLSKDGAVDRVETVAISAANAPADRVDAEPPTQKFDAERQPLLALLAPEGTVHDAAASLAAAGAEVRRKLSTKPLHSQFEELRDALKRVRDHKIPGTWPDAVALQKEFQDVEWRGRAWSAVAPAGCELPAGGSTQFTVDTNVQNLAELTRGQYAVWQAERAIRDFYGPAASAGEPQFVGPARWWLDFARESKWMASIATTRGEELKSWAAATGLLTIKLESPTLNEKKPKGDHRLIATLRGPHWPENLGELLQPQGTAAAWVTLGSDASAPRARPKPPAGRQPVTDALQSETWTFSQTELFPNQASAAADVHGVVFFRGHVGRGNLRFSAPVPDEPGIRRSFEAPPTLANSNIQVNGDVNKKLWLMIVLDCSASMGGTMDNRASEVQGKPPTRLELARRELEIMLDDLTKVQQAALIQIGLMAYGSQVGAPTAGGLQYLGPNGALQKEPPPTVPRPHPATDVRVWVDLPKSPQDPAADLTAQIMRMKQVIGMVQPLGATPLYLSVRRAVEELRPAGAPGDRKVALVITDGVNFQAPRTEKECKDYGIPLPDKSDLVIAEELDTFLINNARGIDVRIVGFAMKDPKKLRAEGKTKDADDLIELEELFGRKDGQFRPGRSLEYDENANALVGELKRLVPKVQFQVKPKDGNIVVESDLGKQVPVRPEEAPMGGKFTISVTGNQPVWTDIRLDGGESLSLKYEENPATLRFARFPDPSSLKDLEGRPQVLENWWIAALPRSPDDTLKRGMKQFRVAVQPPAKDTTKFPGRPKHVFAIVHPQDGRFNDLGADAPPYVFFPTDVRFEPGLPSPVLLLDAENWPINAKNARIQLWFRAHDSESAPKSVIDRLVSEFKDDETLSNSQLPDELRVEQPEPIDAQRFRLKVHQQGLSPMWVRLSPAPHRWSRTVFPREGRIEHEFELGSQWKNHHLFVTSPKELQGRNDPGQPDPAVVEVELTEIPASR